MADFKDLLLKIANNARLTPQELAELSRFGAETQQRNSFIAGNTTADNNLNIQFPFLPIYSQVFEADTASITIQIPSYTHLFCIGSGRCTGATYFENLKGRFNGDTGNNYDAQYLAGVNASVGASQTKAASSFDFGTFAAASATANAIGTFYSFLPHIGSTNWKSVLTIGGEPLYTATDMIGAISTSFWRSTSPITSITIYAPTSTMKAGSVISVFGVR